MWRIGTIRDISSKRAAFFDLHETYGIIYVVKDAGTSKLFANGVLWTDWSDADFPYLHQVRWLSDRAAILWSVPGGAVIVSDHKVSKIPVGFGVRKLIVSTDFLFVAYGEEAVLGAAPEEYEFNVISAFTRSGVFSCGLAKLVTKIEYNGVIIEVPNCYACGDRLIFLAYQTSYVWALDAKAKRLQRTSAISLPDSNAVAILGDAGTCWILSRTVTGTLPAVAVDLTDGVVRQEESDLVPLISAKGFNPDHLLFADAYDGKVIVSDGKMAGILEILA